MIEGIKIDHETADRIAATVLKDDYVMVSQNIRNIEEMMQNQFVEFYVIEDLKYDRKLLKALKRVLAYHMTHDEAKKFIKENK